MLNSFKINKFENHHIKDLYVSEVHGDGTCMIHSALYLYNEKYRNSKEKDRQSLGQQFRINLANILIHAIKKKPKTKSVKSYLSFFKNIEPTLPDQDVLSYVENVVKNPNEWLDDHMISFIELFMKVNIVVFMNGSYYIRGNIYDKDKNIMLFNYIQGTHYEPVFYKNNNQTIYIVNPEEHETLHDKILRSYLKTFRKSPSPMSPPKTPTVELESSKLSSEMEEDTTNSYDDSIPHVEKARRIASDDFDPNASTSIEYYEKFIMEDEIIFEEINDLDEIVFTRIDKSIPIQYSREQTINQVNALYSFMKKGLTISRSQNFVKLLNQDTKSFKYTNMTPMISTSKQFMTDEEDTTEFTKNTSDHLSELSLFAKQPYHLIMKKLEEHYRYLISDNMKLEEPTQHMQTTIRVCPELFEKLISDDFSFDRSDICERYIFETKSKSLIQQEKVFKTNQAIKKMIDTEHYLELYRIDPSPYPIQGYFVYKNGTNRDSKFSKDPFEVFNVSMYFKRLQLTKPKDKVIILLLTKKELEGTVTKHKNGVMEIRLVEQILINDKPYEKIYYYTDKQRLHENWFSLNIEGYPIFKKTELFKKDRLFIFYKEDLCIFENVILPKLDEFVIIHSPQWNSLNECYKSIRNHYDIDFEDIKNEWVNPKIEKRSNSIVEYSKNHSQNTNWRNGIIKPNSSSVYYPNLTSKIFDVDHYMFTMNKSFDHGLMIMNDYIIEQMNILDDDYENVNQYQSELEKTSYTPNIHEAPFYNKLSELLEVRKKLQDNYKYKELRSIISYIKEKDNYVKRRESLRNNQVLKRKNDKNYYLTDIKPQDVMNVSFLEKINKKIPVDHYEGSRNIIDFDDVYNNTERTRDINFESVGTVDTPEDETVTISSEKSIEQMIHQISLEFGGFKLQQDQISYITNNLVHFVAKLFEERTILFKKKNPNVKDLNKMFKTQKEKNKYVEYTNITVISSFLLIFVSIHHKSIEVYNVNKKCVEFFKIQGFPLKGSVGKDANKTTLKYLSCVLSKVYGNNSNLSNQERNEKKLTQVTKMILESKMELSLKLNSLKTHTKAVDKAFSKIFFQVDKSSSKPSIIKLHDNLTTEKTTFEMNKNIYQHTNNILVQLTKTKKPSPSISNEKVIRFNQHIDYSSSKPSNEFKEFSQDTNELSSELTNTLKDLSFRFATNYNDIQDRYIAFKDQDIQTMFILNEALYKYGTNKMLVTISRILNYFNNSHHLSILDFTSKKTSDAEFAFQINKNSLKDSYEFAMIERIYEQPAMYEAIKAIPLPSFDHHSIDSDKQNLMKSSLHYMKIILKYIDEVSNIDSMNEDIRMVSKQMLDNLMETTNIKNLDSKQVEYRAEVEILRENDKQEKYNQKDQMGDDERLLFLMLEKVGYVPEMEEFSKLYEDIAPEDITPNPHVQEIPDETKNPEYTSYMGENDDENDMD